MVWWTGRAIWLLVAVIPSEAHLTIITALSTEIAGRSTAATTCWLMIMTLIGWMMVARGNRDVFFCLNTEIQHTTNWYTLDTHTHARTTHSCECQTFSPRKILHHHQTALEKCYKMPHGLVWLLTMRSAIKTGNYKVKSRIFSSWNETCCTNRIQHIL